MERCKTCAHWKRAKHPYGALHEAGGYCHAGKFGEHCDNDDFKPDMVIYPYYEGAKNGSWWTGPDFGCVHHQPRDTSGEQWVQALKEQS